MDDSEVIARYIEAAGRAAERGSVDRATLEEAARGVGLDEAELALIEERRSGLVERGRGFLETGLFMDAAAAWREACDLSPWAPLPQRMLGEALLGRCRAAAAGNGGAAGEQTFSRAEAALRRAIALEPGDRTSYALLAELEALRRLSKPAARPPSRRKTVLVTILTLSLSAGLVALLILPAARIQDSGGTGGAGTVEVMPAAVTENPPASDSGGERSIPVDALPGEHGLAWSSIRSILEAYDLAEPSWAYRLAASAMAGGTAFRQLSFSAEFLDASGSTLFTRRVEAIGDWQPVHYPGDRIPLSLLVYEKGLPPPIASVRLAPAFEETLRSAGPATAASLRVQVRDETGTALGAGLALAARRVELVSGLGSRYLYVDAVYENAGSRTMTRLKLRCEWLDAAGGTVAQASGWAFITDDPVLEPGARGVHGFILEGPADAVQPASVALTVEEAGFP